MKNNKAIAKAQADIYWLHDAEDFKGLADAAKSIYSELGFDPIVAGEAGSRIADAYQLADEAEKEMKAGDHDEEVRIYNKARKKLEEAEELLKFPSSVAEYQINWWMYFRHKNLFQVLKNIFYQHKPKNGLRLADSLSLCYFLAKVGFSHNKRNKQQAMEFSVKYWNILEKRRTNGYPFLG